jgi:hypothetical protein
MIQCHSNPKSPDVRLEASRHLQSNYGETVLSKKVALYHHEVATNLENLAAWFRATK